MIQDTKEWHDWRKSGIGASEIAAVIGLCPYNTRHSVWMVKTGRAKGFAGNSFTQHGKELEAAARARYELQTMEDFEPACATHPVYKRCIASLDGWNAEKRKILEIKCPTGRKVIDEALLGRVAEHYWPQVQYQMAVAGADSLDFFVYHKASETDKVVPVKPDVRYQAMLINAADDFWKKYVEPDVEPPLSEDDVRVLNEHPQLIKLAARMSEDPPTLTASILQQLKADFITIGGHPKVRCGRVLVSTVNRKGEFSYHKLTVAPEKFSLEEVPSGGE